MSLLTDTQRHYVVHFDTIVSNYGREAVVSAIREVVAHAFDLYDLFEVTDFDAFYRFIFNVYACEEYEEVLDLCSCGRYGRDNVGLYTVNGLDSPYDGLHIEGFLQVLFNTVKADKDGTLIGKETLTRLYVNYARLHIPTLYSSNVRTSVRFLVSPGDKLCMQIVCAV